MAADFWRRLRLMCDMQRSVMLLREFTGNIVQWAGCCAGYCAFGGTVRLDLDTS